jgi:Holliday junction resolvasome RuvABC endonuclease subunit
MILGLDISTSITGYSILDLDGKIIKIGSWDFRNKNNFRTLFEKAHAIRGNLLKIKNGYDVKHIFIEPALHMFSAGKSSAKTLATLTKFNGIVSWFCYDLFMIEPEYIPAVSARKKCGITIKRGEKAKEQVMRFLLDKEPGFSVEWTKHGNPKPHYYDEADSLIIAKAGHECLKEKLKS